MAKVTTVADMGGRPSLRSNRGITDDRSDLIISDAVTDFGEAAIRTGKAAADSRDRFAYQLAKSKFLELDLQTQREVQELDDFRSWDKEYNERMALGRQELIESLSDPQDRVLFEQETDVGIARGSGSMYNAAFKREVDWGRGELTGALLQAEAGYMEAAGPGQRTEYMNNANALINEALAKGYLGDEEATSMRAATTESFATKFVGMQETDDKIAMLQNPENTHAQFIPKPKREQMLKAALAENKRERLLMDAQTAVDASFRPGMSLDALLAIVESGADSAEARDARRNEAIARYNRESVYRKETYEGIADLVRGDQGKIQSGEIGTIDHYLTENVIGTLDESDVRGLEALFDMMKTGEEPAHNDAVWTSLVMTAAREPEKLMNETPYKWRPYLDNQHYDQLVQIMAGLENGDNSAADAIGNYTQILTDYAGGVPQRRSDKGLEFIAGMERWIFSEYGRTGEWPSTIDVRNEAADRAVTVYVRDDKADRDSLVEVDGEDLLPIPAYALRHNEQFAVDVEGLSQVSRDQLIGGISEITGQDVDLNDALQEQLANEVFVLTNVMRSYSYNDIPPVIRDGLKISLTEAYGEPFDEGNQQHVRDLMNSFQATFE